MKPTQQQLDLSIEKSVTATYHQPLDTLIQRKSKRWASKTNMAGESSNLMVAYQMGAKQMEEDVYNVMFDKCKKSEDTDMENCDDCDECYGCPMYVGMIKLFNK